MNIIDDNKMGDITSQELKQLLNEKKMGIEKEISILEKKDEKQEEYRDIINSYKTQLQKEDIYYIATMDKYIKKVDITVEGKRFQEYLTYPVSGMENKMKVYDKITKYCFKTALGDLKRNKEKVTQSFNLVPDDYLNLLSTTDWLQPEDGEVDEWFEILLDSITGGRQEVKDHIEQCLVYKYLHPEEFRIPAIEIHGEGGVGKNTFVEDVLGCIFSKHQVAALSSDSVFGSYTGLLLGKTVVMIDETNPDLQQEGKIRRLVGNKTMDINTKFGTQGNFENTIWWWLTGNEDRGATKIRGDSTDRRFSIIKVDKNIMYWTAKHFDMFYNDKDIDNVDNNPVIKKYFENDYKFKDARFVAVFLNTIIKKWGSLKTPPRSLHLEDYKELKEAQKTVFDDCVEWIFNRPGFTYVDSKTAYKVFLLMHKENNPGSNKVMSSYSFNLKMNKWAEKNTNFRIFRNAVVQCNDGRFSVTLITTGVAGYAHSNMEEYIKKELNQFGKEEEVLNNRMVLKIIK